MAPELIDVDCNLWHRDLTTLQNKELGDGDAWNILKEDAIESSNIVAMLSPSSTIQEAQNGLNLLKNNPPPLPVKTTVGIHPYHVNDDELAGKSLEEHGQVIKDLLQEQSNLCAAVGECGLDNSDGFPPSEDQIPWFRLQVKIAKELNLPLFVHERLAFEDTMDILEGVSVPIIIHCFTGTREQCIAYIKRGYYISLSGYVLKETNDNYNEVISCLKEGAIPLDKLMIETDSPYMGFANCRQLYIEHNEDYASSLNSKKRKRLTQSMYPNVPSSLPMVLDQVVKYLQQHDSSLTREQIAEHTTKNAKQFFGL
jgi:TatD DNase family protein